MLYAFAFERIGVVVSDLYFVDPYPGPGQEGPERGVRLEVRQFERGALHGSIYSAQPISVGAPIWRGDLLETVAGPPGSFDRTHHHPAFTGWEPGRRRYVEDLSADPLGWVAGRLSDLDQLLAEAGFGPDAADQADAPALRAAVPQILDAVRRLLDRVRADRPEPAALDGAAGERVGWL